jgi:hypothetical protein
MKTILAILLAASLPAFGGAFGVGNTADLAMHLQFAKTSAVQFLKNVDLENLSNATAEADAIDFYTQCRETMFRSALKTEFSIISEISDGDDLHAVMRRKGNMIEVNRRMLEKLLIMELLNASRLTAYIIHEVGHDCRYQGQAVDDSFDPLLDRLANHIVQISSQSALSNFLTIDFIEKVEKGNSVYFNDLSGDFRQQLTNAYLDYLGDWAWQRFQQWFAPLQVERPVPASRFNADKDTSIYLGWAQVPLQKAELKLLVRQMLESAFTTRSLTFKQATKNQNLPTLLRCRSQKRHQVTGVVCDLNILWPSEAQKAFAAESMKIIFWSGVLGELKIDKISIL